MNLKTFASAALGVSVAFATVAFAANPMVGGAAMYEEKNIVENAVNSKDHTTLVAAVQAAGLVETLQGDGPFTVFAPTNEAFAKLPAGTVDTLLMPENKGTLTAVLTYHAVAGAVTAADLVKMIEDKGGAVTIDTLAGQQLTVSRFGDTVAITDAVGRTTVVAQADVMASNGVVHVTDGVFLPAQ